MNFTWLQEHALVIAFYIGVALLIYFNKKKFEFQGIVALIKTKIGIKQMQKFATPLPEKKDKTGKKIFQISLSIMIISLFFIFLQILTNITQKNQTIYTLTLITLLASFLALCIAIVFYRQIKSAGTFGIWIGFIGMIAMLSLIFVGLYQLIFVPTAPPMFAPVLPGISIPGSPFKLPLFEGLIALLVVVAIHEFAHGVVSKAYKIPIKSSGFVMFGPLPGAFVEPDEEKLKKAPPKTQLSIYAAGPLSNMLLAGVIFTLMIIMTSFVSTALYEQNIDAIKIEDLMKLDDIEERGITNLKRGEIILGINNQTLKEIREELQQQNITIINGRHALVYTIQQEFKPGDEIIFQTNKGEKTIILGQDKENETSPIIGVYLDNVVEPKTNISSNKTFTTIYFWLFGNPYSTSLNQGLGLISLIFVLSFGIGLVNLLPAGPLDGGRMFFLVLRKKFNTKKSTKILSLISNLLFLLVIILIFVPIIKALI